jgi:Fic family protein
MIEGDNLKCMENLFRAQIPNETTMEYLRLYKQIGKNEYIRDVFEQDLEVMIRQTVRKDTYFFLKYFDVTISDTRFKNLVDKDVKPKNRVEQMIKNLHNAFTKIHAESAHFELFATEAQDLLKYLYGDMLSQKKMQFRKLKHDPRTSNIWSIKVSSTRDVLDQMVQLYKRSFQHPEYEASYIILAFYIDFLHVKPFEDKNEEIALLLMYLLLLANDYGVYDYISFFEILYQNKERFNEALVQAGFNWELGFSLLLPLHELIIQTTIDAYEKLEYLVRDYQFDSKLNKSDNVENTINKLDEVFSKDEIRAIHPYISDSTINRTLKRLREENKIRPLGKGRSAKWIKLNHQPNKKFTFQQLDLDI